MSASQWWKGATGPQDYGQQDDVTKRCAAVKAAKLQRIRSGVCEFTAWFGNWATEFACSSNPFVDDFFCVGHGFGVGLPIGHTAGQFWDFDNETAIVLAPINDQLVTVRHSMSILYLNSSSRTCFTWYGFAFRFRGWTLMISATPSL